ncbi:MAG TPA: energy transducer TonB [Terriglobia bacterium]|nr:energy transducer TonB [Terriglobia bacterium]
MMESQGFKAGDNIRNLRNLLGRKRLSTLLAICFLTVLPLRVLEAKDDLKKHAEDLLSKAAETSNIRAKGSPPFQLTAKLRIQQKDGTFVEAKYLLIWESKFKWREEISFPDFNETVASSDDNYWSLPADEYRPFVLSRLIECLDLGIMWRINPKPKVTKAKEIEQNGVKLICAKTNEGNSSSQYCVDSNAGTLASEPAFSGFCPNMVNEYGDYAAWGNRQFPHSIRVLRDGRLMAEWLVDKLAPEPVPNPSLFAPPAGVKVRHNSNCLGSKIEKAKLILHPTPVYPESAKFRGISGQVQLYAIIGQDGIPHALGVIKSAGPELDAAALDVVRKWRYQPTMCSGNPVEVETMIDVNFELP